MSSAADTCVTVATVKRRGRPRRQYKCAYCAKSFKRSEHCIRHERTHTQEKPFVCRYCHKSYSRKDLVTRHERTLHADVHQKFLHQDQASEPCAERVNVVCPTPARPIALDTPPDDVSEPDVELEGQNTTELPRRKGLPQSKEASFSFSPSSSSSSDSIVINGRRDSLLIPLATTDDMPDSTTIHDMQYPDPEMATSTTRHQYAVSSLTKNRTQTPPSDSSITQISRETGLDAPNTTLIHEQIRDGPVDLIDIDMTMNMALNIDMPLPEAIYNDNDTRNQNNSAQTESSENLDQDISQFLFSSMPNFDIDVSTFALPPMSNTQTENQSIKGVSDTATDFRIPELSMEDIQDFSNLENSALQMFRQLGTSTGSKSSSNTPKSNSNHDLPELKDKRQPPPPIILDDAAYDFIKSDLQRNAAISDINIEIPSAKICQGFLTTYVTSFQGHFPIVHLRSLDLKATPTPLVLAMCSIGALHRLDRRRARRFYDLAVHLVRNIARPSQHDGHVLVKEYCLWYVQTRVLLSFYAVMSGDKELIFKTMHENGFYTLVYNKARGAVGGNDAHPSRFGWKQWIELESWKRLMGGLFIESTLSMVLFNVNPGFNAMQDLEFESFDDEAMWNARSSTEWREIRTRNLNQQHNQRRHTMKEVLVDIMQERQHQSSTAHYQVSAFSALILMHAVVVQMWQRAQVSQELAMSWGSSSYPPNSCESLGSSLLESAMRTLERCAIFLKGAGSEVKPLDSERDEETSLVFNSQAILRIAYVRLFKPISLSSRICLISLEPSEMEDAVSSFITAEMRGGPQLLDAVSKCFEGMRIAVKLGHMLVRKTAALRWSVEHAVAGWECALLVTKWIHSIEINALNGSPASSQEQKLLNLIKDVLEEAEYDLSESVSIASGVAKAWSLLLQDVWIWGITPRMGVALEILAKGYETVGRVNGSEPLDISNRI